jgi:hypothetical protein
MLAAGIIATFVTAFALSGGGEEELVGEMTPTPAGTAVTPPPGGEVTIAAIPIIKFNTAELAIPAGQTVNILFDNQDTGVPHNLAVYSDPNFSQPVAKTDPRGALSGRGI